jgi:archaellum component FlaF (FlaF/FlaG flagellin family)
MMFLFFACSKKNDTSSPTAPVLAIKSITPDSGLVASEILITGTNFSNIPGQDVVKIAGITATVNSATNSQLKITVPDSATSGKITVTVNGQTVTSAKNFTVLSDSTDVYIAAFDNGELTYWKNGMEYVLGRAAPGFYGNVNGIAVIDTDVYVAGYVGDTAVYWKNGKENYLAPFDLGNEVVTSMTTSGSDIYIAGYEERNDGNQIVYWKNGVKTIVEKRPTGYTSASITVSSGDVYVASTIQSPTSSDTAVYWKNGIRTTLAAPYAYASAIGVAGTDVIVAGDFNSAPVYWKNGVMTTLPYTHQSGTYAIATSGNDVYITGVDNGNAVYWKNGSEFILGGGATNAIAINGSDVYITGLFYNANAPINTYSCYWKNGKRVDFVGVQAGIIGDASGNAITVIPR